MPERLGQAWRVVATGICFACFGIGGLVLGWLMFPAAGLVITEPERRHRFAKATIRRAFRAFVGLMSALGVLRYEVEGVERLRGQGQLILANHPSLIDVVFLMAFTERADCIVKGSLARNPFTRGPVRAAGYVLNDSGEQMLRDCVDSIRRGNNLIIFPEGTRSAPDGLARLQRGAARVALMAGVDMRPVVIHCEPRTLGKGEKWYKIPPRRARFRLEIGEPIRVGDLVPTGEPEPIAARRLTEHLTQHFNTETGNARA